MLRRFLTLSDMPAFYLHFLYFFEFQTTFSRVGLSAEWISSTSRVCNDCVSARSADIRAVIIIGRSAGKLAIPKSKVLTFSSQMQSPTSTRWQGAHPDVESQVPLQGQSRLFVWGVHIYAQI